MREKFYCATIVLLLLAPNSARSQSLSVTTASSAPSTNAPAAAAPAAIALPQVVADADSTTAQLHDIDASLSSDSTLATVDEKLPHLTAEIDGQEAEDARLLHNSGSSLAALRNAQSAWHTLAQNLNVSQQALVDRLTVLDGQVKQLGDWTQIWRATLTVAQSSAAPSDIVRQIDNVLAALGQTTKAAGAMRTQTLSAQSRVAEQGARIQDALTAIEKAQANAVDLLFTRDSAPLWSPELRSPRGAGQDSFAAQIGALWIYLKEKASTLVLHLVGFLLLGATLFWVRREVNARVKNEPALLHAADVFEVPLATAALLALLVGPRLYPLAPRLFLAGIEAAALVPAVIILRRLIEPALFSILYALVLFYVFDQLRYVTNSSEVVSRGLFLLELVAGTLFLAWLIRSRGATAGPDRSKPMEQIVTLYAHAGLLLFVVSGVANVLGYVHLSLLLGSATLSSGYLALILYAAVRVADALTLSALQIPPLYRFGLVQRHHALLAQNMFRIFRWLAALFWLWKTLDLFSLWTPLEAKGSALLLTKVGWGHSPLNVRDLLAFGLTIWASFFISKIIRIALEEEVFPQLHLPEGVPYTASTLIHYLVLILGFLAALSFLGIGLTHFVVLAGALGVGLGLGLQTIMNNFFSGIVLLFERPIKIGDIIQVDTAIGTVERIGIRASIIRLADGSGVIVPNANLISNQVINWTFAGRRRMIGIPVTVVSKTDPQQVMALLVKIAREHRLVLENPPPQALVTNLTAAATALELRVWTDDPAEWVRLRSDLSVAINAALAQENIALG